MQVKGYSASLHNDGLPLPAWEGARWGGHGGGRLAAGFGVAIEHQQRAADSFTSCALTSPHATHTGKERITTRPRFEPMPPAFHRQVRPYKPKQQASQACERLVMEVAYGPG